MVDAAQRVAGVLAARGRGDGEGARALMASFDSPATLAAGSLLVAELMLGLYERAAGTDRETCLRELALSLEARLGA
jgi:hypothetical protein